MIKIKNLKEERLEIDITGDEMEEFFNKRLPIFSELKANIKNQLPDFLQDEN